MKYCRKCDAPEPLIRKKKSAVDVYRCLLCEFEGRDSDFGRLSPTHRRFDTVEELERALLKRRNEIHEWIRKGEIWRERHVPFEIETALQQHGLAEAYNEFEDIIERERDRHLTLLGDTADLLDSLHEALAQSRLRMETPK